MSVSNKAPSVITDVTLDFLFGEGLLRIDRYEPPYEKRNGKILLGNISGGTSKSIAVYFDPLMCTRGAEINCQITSRDAQGKLSSVFMEPKLISVVCPIIKTELDINVGRLKEFIEKLPSKDSKVYEIQQGFDVSKLSSIAREVVEKHDVRHVRTLKTKDGRDWEIWYYGKTKVTKTDIVIRVSISSEKHLLELFAATETAETLAGLLAEVGRDLKQSIEFRESGTGSVINVMIRDSVIQRSNLLDLCSMDGTCPINILVEDSIIQHSNIASLRADEEKPGWKKPGDAEKSQISPQTVQSPARERALLNSFPSSSPAEKRENPSGIGVPVFGLVFVILLVGAASVFLSLNDGPTLVASSQNPDTYTNSIGMEFVKVPAGEFVMGTYFWEKDRVSSEGPVHRVTIEEPFYMGKFEVTQEQWREVMGDNPSRFKADNNPVECVSRQDAQEFIEKLNQMEGTDKYRLPSEAEWEYACRAGTTTVYSFGDDESELGEHAWYDYNSGGETHSVGQKLPNSWGLYDMHGNVLEWCQDMWHDNYDGAPFDGSAWRDGHSHNLVIRGGGWNSSASFCRSAKRGWASPNDCYYNVGFRVLRVL